MALASGGFTLTLTDSVGGVTEIGDRTSDTTSAFLETVDLDMSEPMVLKFIQRLHLWMDKPRPNAATNMRIIIKARNSLDQEPVILLTIPLYELVKRWKKYKSSGSLPPGDIGDDYVSVSDFRDYPINVRLPGYRFYKLRIEDNGVTEFWRFFGMNFYGTMRGTRF